MDFHKTHVKKEYLLRAKSRATLEKGFQILNTRCSGYSEGFQKCLYYHIYLGILPHKHTHECMGKKSSHFCNLGGIRKTTPALINLRSEA